MVALHFSSAFPRRSRRANEAKLALVRHPGVLFEKIVPSEVVTQACRILGHLWRERVFTPLVTLWTFLSQVLNADSSCCQAVARTLGFLSLSHGLDASHDPSAYCKARKRLPEDLLPQLTRWVAQGLAARVRPQDLWRGHRAILVDGSSVAMSDSPKNQAAYPQPQGQKAGCGFPTARLVGLFDLFTGALRDLALGPLSLGETVLFHTLWRCLRPGDVAVADCYYCSYADIALVRQRGAHGVWRLHQRRKRDLDCATRLGPDDYLVEWPKEVRPHWISPEAFAALPGRQTVRLVRFQCRVPGWRAQVVWVATTLLDPVAYPAWDIAHLFGRRWEIETDWDHLKTTLNLEFLRTRTPHMVRRELWAHLLAYNLIRTLMWDAAQKRGISPLRLSFKGAVQEMIALWPFSASHAPGRNLTGFYDALLRGIAYHRIPERLQRAEPRVRKRRPKNYRLMTQPRNQYKRDFRTQEH
jgi:hypothetical protein